MMESRTTTEKSATAKDGGIAAKRKSNGNKS